MKERTVGIELSLVRVFCSIYEAGSVSRAAALLDLTQPAVSYSLALLRRQLGDPLFMRSRTGMSPTPLADKVYTAFRHGLESIDEGCKPPSTFDPRTLR